MSSEEQPPPPIGTNNDTTADSSEQPEEEEPLPPQPPPPPIEEPLEPVFEEPPKPEKEEEEITNMDPEKLVVQAVAATSETDAVAEEEVVVEQDESMEDGQIDDAEAVKVDEETEVEESKYLEKTEPSSGPEGSTEDAVMEEVEGKDESNEVDYPDDGKSDAVYSTRGRTGDHTSTDLLDSLARESELSLAREREHAPSAAIGASFLSESLTEEERRTRTRYLPDVEGFHALRKNEVKGDLALARSIISANGVAALLIKKKRPRDDDMEVDGEDPSPSEDDRSSDALRANAKVIEMGRNDYVLPATAFVAPPATTTSSNGENSNRGAGKSPPTEVESVAAFNPPRPPESVGPKKKHRMLRWEQNPASIEVDLANYRKTVQKTRQELKNAQNERDRIVAVDNHIRRNFFGHLQALNDELFQLSQELSTVQQECVNSADLLTSRTRSRGAGKGSYVMRDVLTVLRTRGAEMEEKRVTFENVEIEVTESGAGVGGVGAVSFEDWNNSTNIEARPPASSWIVPGDTVTTPYGRGKVKKILSPEDSDDRDSGPHTGASSDGSKERRGSGKSASFTPRVAVELPFGVGYFPLSSVASKENPSTYSDSRLAQRWKGIIESAPMFGSYLDLESMQAYVPWEENESEPDGMDVDEEAKSEAADEKKKRLRILPFGSDVIPTSVGRGGLLHKTGLIELDKKLHQGLYDGVGVLGNRDNQGVPTAVRELENRKERYIRAKAQSLQLTNALLRQRRITKMNEKTLEASQERSSRVEALVSEMRSDLGSLKNRLDEEVRALGISEAEAIKILSDHYGQNE